MRDHQRRALSPETLRARLAVVDAFVEFIHPRWLGSATTEDVQWFLDSRKLGAQGRYTYIAHLNQLYVVAMRDGLVSHNPTTQVIRPRLPRRVPRPISEADLAVALAMADRRMRAWLCLGAYAGFRRQEIAGLRRDDILETNDPPVLIASRGKGGRERIVPLNPHVWEALVDLGLPKRGFVFHRDGKPLLPATVGQGIANFLRGLGIDATAHRARHSFATAVYQRSLDLRLTQSLLGHASPDTTAIYAGFAANAGVDVVRSLGASARSEQV